MKTIHKYESLWVKVLPDLLDLIELSTFSSTDLDKSMFENVGGNRKKTGYSFSLILENGIPVTSVKSSAVIRDLLRVMLINPKAKTILINKKIKIQLDKNFSLTSTTI